MGANSPGAVKKERSPFGTAQTLRLLRRPKAGATLANQFAAAFGGYDLGVDRPLVIFDGDDTLWWSEELYDAARNQAGEIVAESGLDATEWDRLERQLDLENVTRLGLSSERFPTSCAEAYREVSIRHGVRPDERIARAVYEAAASVFKKKASPVDGVETALDELSAFAELALLTKGDDAVQRKRIADSGLSSYFSLIDVVGNKTHLTFKRVLDRFRAVPADAWSVGNSLLSDILPAVEIGMSAVWIEAHVWEHEQHRESLRHPRIHKVERIGQVPELVRSNMRQSLGRARTAEQ